MGLAGPTRGPNYRQEPCPLEPPSLTKRQREQVPVALGCCERGPSVFSKLALSAGLLAKDAGALTQPRPLPADCGTGRGRSHARATTALGARLYRHSAGSTSWAQLRADGLPVTYVLLWIAICVFS